MIDLMTIGLLGILSLKIASITGAISWLAKHGRDYAIERREDKDITREHFYELFEKHHGGIFPFGFKDYRLRQLIIRLENGKFWCKAINIPIKIFQGFLYRFERLTFVVAIYCVLVAPLCKAKILHPHIGYMSHCILITAMSILLVLANFILSIEAVYSYGVLGSYAAFFHMLFPQTEAWSGGSSFLIELRVLVGKLVTTIVSGATAFYVTHIIFITLKGNITVFDSSKLMTSIVVFLQSLYFSLTTLLTVGYGDISPKTGLGQFVSFLVQLQSFALLGIVLTTIAAFKSANGKE